MSMTTPAAAPAAPPAAADPAAPLGAFGAPTPAPAPAPAPAPPAGEPAAPPANEPPAASDDSPWVDPARAKAEIDRLRRENGDARIQAKKQAAEDARKELLQSLTQALDPDAAQAQQTLTPEQLVANLQTTSTERDTAFVDRDTALRDKSVVLEAWKQGVDPTKLDYLTFQLSRRADFGTLSPSSDDFGATLTSVISDEITKDSSLKSSGANIATGAPQFGGAGGAGSMSKAEFDALPYAGRVELYNTNRAEYDRLVNS